MVGGCCAASQSTFSSTHFQTQGPCVAGAHILSKYGGQAAQYPFNRFWRGEYNLSFCFIDCFITLVYCKE